MNLRQAIEAQVCFCENNNKYKCGIFVDTREKQEDITQYISTLLMGQESVQCKNSKYERSFCWNNGSYIRVIPTVVMCRGTKFNGAIIDDNINRDIVNFMIMPYLMERVDSSGYRVEEFDDVKKRIFTVEIGKGDAIN